jgi:zinc transporter 9
MAHGSKKAVITAILSNAVVTVIKFLAALTAGSAAMMNEAVHSLMDTLNQGFLFFGLREAERPADATYAFGHGQKRYLWNLWSAIGLFSIGAGLGLAHAWHSWHKLGDAETASAIELPGITISPLTLNLLVLAMALLLEGFSFLVALREFRIVMRRDGYRNPLRYLMAASDPTLVAVVLEDSVAMLGLLFAALGVGLAALTGQAAWDILFSALIALMLGVAAFYLGWTNMRFLADMRDTEAEELFLQVAKEHGEIERCHDLRSIIIDQQHTVLVAEIELREEALVPDLHDRMDAERKAILELVPHERRQDDGIHSYAAIRAAVQTTLARTEQIIDELEQRVRTLLPRITHITIEVEGIAPPPKDGPTTEITLHPHPADP